MIDTLSFVNNHWFWYVVIATVLLWFFFAWKEWRQNNKSKLFLKLVLAFIGLSSLALIVLKPLVISNLDKYELAVLTKGYSSEQLDSLKKVKKKLQSYRYKVSESFIDPNKIPSSIYLLGEGIAPFDFYQIDSLNVSYLGNVGPSGIVKLNYLQEQTLSNSVDIKGLYARPTKGVKLVLQSPSKTSLDSVVFTNDSTQIFKLTTTLNIIGNFEYHVVEKDSTDKIIRSNPIGIQVIAENTMNILIINGFPTFETKYLKNFLAEKGHEIAVRSQVTTGKFKYEYFNLSIKPLIDFSEKSLAYFDLIIIDAQSFRNLGRSQKTNLENIVRNEGLGVFIQTPTNFNTSVTYLTDFKFQTDNKTTIALDEWPKVKISKNPFNFKPQFSLQGIHQTNGQIFSAYKPLGNGSIGTSVFENTFELILEGNSNIYQILWTKTINALTKKNMPLLYWGANKNIVFKDEPFTFSVRSHISNPKVLDERNHLIPLINDINNSSLWKGTTYPNKVGWQSQYFQQDSTQVFNYYVTDTTHWKSLQSFNTMKANKKQFETKQNVNKPFTTQQPMTLTLVYVLFLLCFGYLWLEPKL